MVVDGGVGTFTIVNYLVPPWLSGWMMLAVNPASGAAVLLAVRIGAPAHPLPWHLIGTGLLTYGTGNAVWFSYNLLLDAGSSVFSLANLFYAAGYGFVAAGLVLALRRRDPAGFSAATAGELDAMRRFGCNYGQGFLMCRPLPVARSRDKWSQRACRPLESLADRPQLALSAGSSTR
ncbi:MAG: hypothetical protein M3124_03470 [Actinomycetota bacterium]|nr:hypothetical protein [Actinomycetota bacterium]